MPKLEVVPAGQSVTSSEGQYEDVGLPIQIRSPLAASGCRCTAEAERTAVIPKNCAAAVETRPVMAARTMTAFMFPVYF